MPAIGLSEDGNTITIHKFDGQIPETSEKPSEQTAFGVFLDVETTGLDPETDRVIEIGLVLFEYGTKNGQIYRIVEEYSGLQDPEFPIPPEITRITGITADMVRGKEIDTGQVREMLEKASIIISHNARFDRPFVENFLKPLSAKLWGCSLNQIEWAAEGCACRCLEHLCRDHGFFYDGHRALMDVKAAVKLLAMTSKRTNQAYLQQILQKSSEKQYLLQAVKAPFEKKDLLKGKRFRWNAKERVWEIITTESELEDLQNWLEIYIYDGRNQGKSIEINPKERFSGR